MRFFPVGKAAIFAGIFLPFAAALGYGVVDSTGKHFEFERPPRAATIVPAVTQNIYAVGAGNFLEGNSRYCSIPEDAKNKVKLGGFVDPDYEKIAELSPEIFILPALSDTRIPDRLKRLGIPVFTLHGEGLKNISADLRMLGELFQCGRKAEEQARRIERELSGAPKVGGASQSAFFMFGKMAAGKGSYVGELLEICGLRNCAAASGRAWFVPSREFVISSAPDIIFAELPDGENAENIAKFYREDPAWKNTPAVRGNRIYFIGRDLVGVPSVRVIEALKQMRGALKNGGNPKG